VSLRPFLSGARAAARLVASERVAAAWDAPSALPGMTTGELAAHLARAVLQVAAYRGATSGDGARPTDPTTDAVGYFADLAGTTEPGSALNTGVRERAVDTAAVGHAALVQQLDDTVDALARDLPAAPPDELVVVGHRAGQVLTLTEYLRTRCVELAVHLEDLALSLGCDPGVPPSTAAVAVDVLQAAARRRHGDVAVLRALARRERDQVDAARVL
jgi:uncharacterized protein (TIGR03083 family)